MILTWCFYHSFYTCFILKNKLKIKTRFSSAFIIIGININCGKFYIWEFLWHFRSVFELRSPETIIISFWSLRNMHSFTSIKSTHVAWERRFDSPRALTRGPGTTRRTGPGTSSCCWRCPRTGSTGTGPSAPPTGCHESWPGPRSISCFPPSISPRRSSSPLTKCSHLISSCKLNLTSTLWPLNIRTGLVFYLKNSKWAT